MQKHRHRSLHILQRQATANLPKLLAKNSRQRPRMVKNMTSYEEGFEDSLELCLSEVKESSNKKDVVQRIRYLLGLVKEHKFDRVKQIIGAIK